MASVSPHTTVLVTGGSGFVGTWALRELLTRGARVVVYDLHPNRVRWQRILGADATNVVFHQGDLADRAHLAQVCGDEVVTQVVHLGALLTPACQEDPWLACQVNVLGSVAVFELARRCERIRGLAYASSLAVYGPAPEKPSATEVGDTHAPTFYGAFKRSVEMVAAQYWKHFGVASFGLRPHVVYGPERDQGLTAAPSLAARAVAEGDEFEINYTGMAGYDYVEDVALALVRGALESPPGAHVVDLPSDQATPQGIVDTLETLVPGAAARLAVQGPPIPVNQPPRRSLITQLFPDWQATPLREGLARTLEFYGGPARGGL